MLSRDIGSDMRNILQNREKITRENWKEKRQRDI